MEQARILQAIISRGMLPTEQAHQAQQQQAQQQQAQQQQAQQQQLHQYDKEITITQSGLIEVSSDDESDSSSDSETDSSSESEDDKWSIGDEIHQPESYHREFEEGFRKNILIDSICIDSSYVIDSISIQTVHEHEHEHEEDDASTKKIISLHKSALGAEESDDDADDASSSSEEEVQDKANVHDVDMDVDVDVDLNLKIGYKPKKEPLQLNYANMSVTALRQLAKERGLGGEDGDLQKLKKKDLVQLLQ
jgi:type II secretory pathway pseudopilin PulG